MARMASAIDDLSGGRLFLGMGAGWQEREHNNYGFELGDVPQRFKRFAEALEVTTKLLHSDTPVEFSGEFYQLHDAILLPRPARPGGPRLVIGGNGERRTLPLVARYASEWNAVFLPPAKFSELSARLDALLKECGRAPGEVRRTMMTGLAFGRDQTELEQVLNGRDPEDSRARGMIVGTPDHVGQQLTTLAEAGVQRVMLQWMALDDLDRLAAFAEAVLPQFPAQLPSAGR
jgi:alkanesulfonate monooxygenase SsuD/methylene tetrahydromethanopterin reductase-like flavin-dependent oxidoreductase (luciferase family)